MYGASLVTAIVVLLLLSSIAAYVLSLAAVQQSTSTADLMGARALSAARAGTEWAAYQILKNPAGGYCTASTDSATLGGFGGVLDGFVTVIDCVHTQHAEAAASDNVHMYTLTATACNRASCPSPAPGANYVERQVTVVLGRDS